MTNLTVAAVLPVGKFNSDHVKKEFDTTLQAICKAETELMVAEPVADMEAARQSIQALSQRDPDLLIIIPLHGLSAQVIETAASTSRAPCLVTPLQGRYALPSSALAIGALREENINLPVELLYAPPDHSDFSERLRTILRTSKAFSRIRRAKIGVIGDLFPNLVSCRYDPQIVKARLGVTLLPVSFDMVRSVMQARTGNSQEEETRQVIENFHGIRTDDRHALEAGFRLHMALKQIALEQKLEGFAAECWSGFPKELGLNPCLGFIEDAYALACEGDVMLCISLLIVRYLTGKSAFVGDLYDLNMEGIMTLVHCGAPASLAADKSKVTLTRSALAQERGFETMTCRPSLDQGPVTIFRFYGRECDRLHLTTGELMDSQQSPNLEARIKVHGDRRDFLDQCFGNHYLVVAGDIRNELELLCKWLNITVFET